MAKFKVNDTVAFVDDAGRAILGTIVEYDAEDRVYVINGKLVDDGVVVDNYGYLEMSVLQAALGGLKKYTGKPEDVEKFLADDLKKYRKNREISVEIAGTLKVRGPVGSDKSLLEKAIKKAVAQIYGQRAKWYNDLSIS